jgi:membrane fusion protein, multidrug efflux system
MRAANVGTLLLAASLSAQQPVETVRLQSRSVSRTVQLTGELAPWETVDIRARVSGFVERVNVDRGSLVKAGQVLAILSAPEMDAQIAEARARVSTREAEVAEAKARLATAEAVAKRLKEASATPGAISRLELETAEQTAEAARGSVKAAEAAKTAAEASVQSVERLRGYLRITAPFSGVITERMAHPGALASPDGEPLLRIEQVSPLRLVVAVPEANYAGAARGTRVPFRVAAQPGQTFTGRIARVPRSVDPKTRTMAVELDVTNAGGQLAPGMYAEVDWPVSKKAAFLVPATAVATTTERVFVIRVQAGRAEWVNVRRGAREGDLVEVQGDLAEGDVILRRASDETRDGSRIKTAEPKPSQPS